MEMLKVTSQELLDSSSRLNAGADEVASLLTRLHQLIEPLAASWQSGASNAFQDMWHQWDTNAKGLNDALKGISQLLGNAGHTYAEAEATVKASMAN